MTVNNIVPTLFTLDRSFSFKYVGVCDFHWISVITEEMNFGGLRYSLSRDEKCSAKLLSHAGSHQERFHKVRSRADMSTFFLNGGLNL